jgi:hypothetical protein
VRIGAVAAVRFRRCAARHIERSLLHEEESCGDQGIETVSHTIVDVLRDIYATI